MTIYAFNLSKHSFEWIKTPKTDLYKYNPNIAEKLILPTEHKDLIDILLSDDVQQMGGDIIEGKGEGTLILTKGKAGVGKTATAEIYSNPQFIATFSQSLTTYSSL